jgi:hypothetical protein
VSSDVQARCAICSKPIQFGGFVGNEDGTWVHLACHGGIQSLENNEERDRATPPVPVCAACSKPIRSGTRVLFERGAWFHVACHSRRTQRKSIAVRQRVISLMEQTKRRQAARRVKPKPRDRRFIACPLCRQPVTLTDWRPEADWIAVEGCLCRGFLVWAPLLTERVRQLSPRQRQDLSNRIRAFRAGGHEAWLTTTDGTTTGPLVIRTKRPNRPTEAADPT